MTRREDEYIRRWYRRAKYYDDTGEYPTGNMGPRPRGFDSSLSSLTRRDGELTCEYISGANLVRMVLPNLLTWWRYRHVIRVLKREGAHFLYMPNSVMGEAEITRSSIKVIATQRRWTGFLRVPAQVIQAEVRPRWGAGTKRKAFFLSGYDANERTRRFFFCELPSWAKVKTIRQALVVLKPEAVREAERAGIRVKRQGDIFLIPMRGMNAKVPADSVVQKQYILKTNHLGAEVVRIDGLTYVRRHVRHAPIGRRADHKTLYLGPVWHLAVKNTVPVAWDGQPHRPRVTADIRFRMNRNGNITWG